MCRSQINDHRTIGVYGFLMLSIAGGIVWVYQGGSAAMATAQWFLSLKVPFCVVGMREFDLAMRTRRICQLPCFATRVWFCDDIGCGRLWERPDGLTVIGSMIIVVAVPYTVWQSRRTAPRRLDTYANPLRAIRLRATLLREREGRK